jgi:hypothetical protein
VGDLAADKTLLSPCAVAITDISDRPKAKILTIERNCATKGVAFAWKAVIVVFISNEMTMRSKPGPKLVFTG